MKASYHCAVMLTFVFAGTTCDIVGFAVLWLTCEFVILTAQYYIFMNVNQYFTKKQCFYIFFIN